MENQTITEIRIDNHVSQPFDPLKIKTMAEYNFALIYARTWFEYDDGRKALPGIIKSWEFNTRSGFYKFHIDHNAKWSDGTPITPEHLLYNLNRSIALNTSYGSTISAIISIETFKKTTDHTFLIATKNKKPSSAFFERMGSIFLSVIHPNDTDKLTHKVVTNKISAGPYKILDQNSDYIKLIPNEHFNIVRSGPKKITMRQNSHEFILDEFLSQKSWTNIYQTSSYLPLEWEQKIIENKLPYWSRGHDRISLFRPGFGKSLEANKELIKQISNAICNHFQDNTKLPFNVARAHSLQPNTYPLYHEKLHCSQNSLHSNQSRLKVKVLAHQTPVTDLHEKILSESLNIAGIGLVWDKLPFPEYLKKVSNSSDHDIIFLSFGVADPEPSTWLSLIKDSKFVEFDKEDTLSFNAIIKEENEEIANEQFRTLLKSILNKGGYVPLFHGSTLVIGHQGINFTKIRELDETVDLSKLIQE